MKKTKLAIVMILMLSMLFSTTAFAAGGENGHGVAAWKESTYSDDQGNMTLVVFVRNDNGVDCTVSMDAYLYGADGSEIETTTSDTAYLQAGESYALVARFGSTDNADSYDFDLIVNPRISSYDVQSANDCIDVTFSDNSSGTVKVNASNTSSEIVEAKAIVLFLKDDQVVDYGEVYLSSDNDYLLSPGEETEEVVRTNYAYDSSTMFSTAVR